MRIEIHIDEHCADPKVIIVAGRMTDEIHEIVRKLSEEQMTAVAGFKGETVEILRPEHIFRIYASRGKVFAETETGEYVLRMRLYEAEERTAGHEFVRISNAEIINLRKVKGFDLSFTGTVCVRLTNGTVTYVSRRFVPKIKQILGI